MGFPSLLKSIQAPIGLASNSDNDGLNHLGTTKGKPWTRDDCFVKELYQKLSKPLLYKALRTVGNQSVAEEILQESFVRFMTENLHFTCERAAFRWLYTCCHRLAIDHIRGMKHRAFPQQDIEVSDHGDSHRDNHGEARIMLAELSSRLTPEELEVVGYLYMDEMTQDEIADLLNCSRKTIVRMVAKVREKAGCVLVGEPQ